MCYEPSVQQIAARNAGWPSQFRFAVHVIWSRVPELWTLGGGRLGDGLAEWVDDKAVGLNCGNAAEPDVWASRGPGSAAGHTFDRPF